MCVVFFRCVEENRCKDERNANGIVAFGSGPVLALCENNVNSFTQTHIRLFVNNHMSTTGYLSSLHGTCPAPMCGREDGRLFLATIAVGNRGSLAN